MGFDDYDWYCDECDAYLNDQDGFYAGCGTWICKECGHLNYIDEDNIIEDESLSVYDAALIWASNGKDEDYMFGYSEEELEDALR